MGLSSLISMTRLSGRILVTGAKSNNDKIHINDIVGKHIFVNCTGKYSDTKYTNTFFETKLKVSATSRNWKTVLKLAELAGSQ